MSEEYIKLSMTQEQGCANPYSTGGLIPHPRSMTTFPLNGETYSVIVDKTTHRIRFQDETESGVVIVIEPKT